MTDSLQKVISRPDLVSAGVSARAQGSRVEVESLRTETSSTWINPDGTLTSDVHAAPVRFKDTSGQWQDIDLSLVKGTDGSVAPRSHAHDLELGKPTATAGGVFASATAGAGREVEWVAPWKLPVPTVEDTKATYSEVQPGVDLVLDARRSGFEHDFVVKHRPQVAPVWRIPLRTKGLTARPQSDGSIQFVDANNVVRSVIPVAQMWDAVTDPASGLPANTARVHVTVEQQSPGRATLVITPDAAWFLDPARVFPVTVDPTYATGSAVPSFDTWVQSDVTTDQSASAELRVGSWDSGATKTRSFLNFSTAPFQGKQILGATLSLFESYSHTCTASTFLVKSANTASTSTRWTSQPTTGGQYGSATAAKGFSSACPAGRVEVPITGLAQAWSTASYATGGLAVVAANENDSNGWKRFHSTEGTGDPFISITWNRAPATPAVPTFASAVAYAPFGGSSVLYTPYLKPWTQTKATDADGNNVRYTFEFHNSTTVSGTSLKATCSTATGKPSGTTDGCTPTVNLPDNTAIYVRAKTTDGFLDSGWSGWRLVRVGTQTPAAPSISCPSPYVINSWQDSAPAGNVVCTITATGTGYSAPGYVRVMVDGKYYPTNFLGGAAGQIKITPSSDPAVAKTTVTVPKEIAGLHRISAWAESPAGKLSASSSYSFGWGKASLTSPTASPRTTTTGAVKVEASGPPRGSSPVPTASLRWRISGYASGHETVGWNTTSTALTVTDNGAAGIAVSGLWDTATATQDAYLDSDPNTAGVQATTLNPRLPVLLDVQICLTYASSTQCTWSESPDTTVQRVPHAFGNGFPVADAGPGAVALWTGEFSTETTDISVPGYTGDLSVSRSHATYAGAPNTVNSVFGPGWVAQFDGTDDGGAAGLEVVDSSHIDGTISLLAGDGAGLTYEAPGGRRTTAALATGTWIPADEDTELDAGKLAITGTGTATTLTYTADDGTVTTFKVGAAPVAAQEAQFRTTGIAAPGIASGTSYSYDGTGRITRILAPAPPGVTCPATGALNPGCRALRFDYGTTGDASGRLTAAWLDIYNPAKAGGAGMDSIKVAEYTYSTGGRLQKVTDPRSGLSTEYGYSTDNHLTSVTPAGEIPYQLNYLTAEGRQKLSSVTRARPAGDPTGGTATLSQFVYDVPLTGPGLPDLSATSVARWGQRSIPAKGYAVFAADHPVSGTPTDGDWVYADLQYADANGYTVNTAAHGAGAWQYTATDYDAQGNEVRELDERALRLVIDGGIPAGASVDQLATLTVYNADITNTAGEVITPAGTLVTDTYEPSRFAALRDGSIRWVRSRTHTEYDEFAPNNGINPSTSLPYRLETREYAAVHDPGTGSDLEVTSGSVTKYGDADGWNLGLVGSSILDMDHDGAESSGDQVGITWYDAEGRIIEERQPRSAAGTGNDAGTVKTVYFTAAANATFPECGAKPQWAGLVCKTYPGGAPASEAGQPSTPTTPTTTVTSFNYLLQPLTSVETSGAVTRTTTLNYLADGRAKGGATTVTGLPGSTATTRKDITYDTATGLPTVSTAFNADNSVAGTVTAGYDGWGRPTSYQPSGESATTTTYNAAGLTATVTDANGTSNYTYGGTDAAGRTETRTLPTRVDVTTSGGTWTSTAAYDADEALTLQRLPGGISQITRLDNAGEPVGLEYTGQITTINSDGTTSVDPDGGWLSWSQDNDVDGRLAREWTPDGAAFTGPATGNSPADVGDATPYDRAYRYDTAGRLTQVKDRTGTAGIDILDPTQTACTTRTYGFDANGNRLTKATATSGTDGTCPASGGTTTTRAYDTADRPTSGANGQGTYTYDLLGRTLTLPASDAPKPSLGDITLAYYDNDLAHTITQGGTTTSFTLDALDRRSVETTTSTAGTSQVTRHYTDESDNPTWTTHNGATRRYTELIGDDLSLTVAQAGNGELTLNNRHGDIVTTVALTNASTTATAISGWNDYDEYGITGDNNTATTGPVQYGWLGAHQRATSGAGLILMGARLYNNATGLFTSIDSIPGGNDTAYAYPNDPVNQIDLDGHMNMRNWGGRSRGADHGGGATRRTSKGHSRPPARPASQLPKRHGYNRLNNVLNRIEKSNRSKFIHRKGKRGMEKAGVKKQNTKRVWITPTKYRVPDFYSKSRKLIGEVKYFRKGRTLGASKQIRRTAEWAMNNGFKYVIRVNRGVKLSKNLRRMERLGLVTISRYG